MINVLIVDDHEIVRSGLQHLLRREYPAGTISEADSAENALARLDEREWDVVICDLSMPGIGGLELIQHLQRIKPDLAILVLSAHPEAKYARRVLQAGASGYLSKQSASHELLLAIKKVLQGKKYISTELAETLAAELNVNRPKGRSGHDLLSEKEFNVFLQLAAGNPIVNISKQLFLSPNTISTYRARILAKMDLKSNAELVKYAVEHGLDH